MPLIRVTEQSDHTKTLTNADKVALAQRRNDTGSVPQPEDPSQVSVFVLPDITGLDFGIRTLAQEILRQSKEDNSCDLYVTSTPLPTNKEGIKKLPFTSNAAYVNCRGRIFYVNKCKSSCIYIKKMTPQKTEQFNEAMKVDELGDHEYRKLSANELKTITTITGHEHDNRRPVYMYNDNDILTGMYQIGLPIENEADTIAKLMEEKHPNGPFIIVAYSYSGLLAIELMQTFTKKNLDAFVVIVDAPAPELSKALLTSKSEKYVQCLLDIVNYTAKICFTCLTIKLSAEQINEFKVLPPAECMKKLAEIASKDKFYSLGDSNAFETLIEFESLRLEKMAHYEKEFHKPLPGPSKAKIILTNETIQKYQDAPFGGWDGYATNMEYLQYKETNTVTPQGKVVRTVVPQEPHEDLLLASATHQSIVQNHNAAILGRTINDFISENITREYLDKRKWFQIWQQTQESAENDPVLADVAAKLKECVEKRYSPVTTPESKTAYEGFADKVPATFSLSSSDSSLFRKPKFDSQEPSKKQVREVPTLRTP